LKNQIRERRIRKIRDKILNLVRFWHIDEKNKEIQNDLMNFKEKLS
jgi:hypothetical protein